MTSATSSRNGNSSSPAELPQENKKVPFVSPEVASYFVGACSNLWVDQVDPISFENRLAGGCAGAASRTVVSPLERLKIIQCV